MRKPAIFFLLLAAFLCLGSRLVHAGEFILDNADPGALSLTGQWTLTTASTTRYGANYLTDGNAGKGFKAAAWNLNLAEAGEYEVAIRNPASSSYASAVPVDILASTGNISLTLNQRVNNNMWLSLGVYPLASGLAPRVQIRNAGTVGSVLVDAVRFHQIGTVVDDNAASNVNGSTVEAGGAWTASTTAKDYFGVGYRTDNNTGKGTKSFRFRPQIAATGKYQVELRWSAGSDRSAATPVILTHLGGATNFSVNQKLQGGDWFSLGTFWFIKGKAGSLEIRNAGTTGYVVADAVNFLPVPLATTDVDLDGLPDEWEIYFFGSVDFAPGGDNDADGLTNAQEYQLGTLPDTADSDGDGMTDGAEVAFGLDPFAQDADLDPDGDGLSNRAEYAAGTNWRTADTDGDGFSDKYEVENGLNPNADDRAGDLDGDGLTNLQEYQLGTRCNQADTDGDTMNDAWEVAHQLNPLDAADGWQQSVTYSAATINSYGGSSNDVEASSFAIEEGGTQLRLWGNTWKAVALGETKTITADLTIRLESRRAGPQVAEIVAFGFDNDLTVSPERNYRIGGTDSWTGSRVATGLANADWQWHYIRPGAALSGTYKYLTFVHDNDSHRDATITFRRAELGRDIDGDGLFNREEAAWGTDPRISDTDGDGIADGLEVLNGMNPLQNDSAQDLDGDGIPNGWEVPHGLNPLSGADAVQDADGDGYSNLQEWALGGNPFVWEDLTAPSAAGDLQLDATATTVYLRWTAATDNNAVAGYQVWRDGTLVTTVSGTRFTDSGCTPGQTGHYSILAVDGVGNLSPALEGTVALSATPGLPPGFVQSDFGTVQKTGAAATADGRWMVSGAGSALDAGSSHGHFVGPQATPSTRVTARIKEQQITNPQSSAGLIVRGELGETQSLYAALYTVEKSTYFQFGPRGNTFAILGSNLGAPRWLRMEVKGNRVVGYQSTNGQVWTQVAQADLGFAARPYIGLFADAAGDIAGPPPVGVLSTALFEQVEFDQDTDGDGLYDLEESNLYQTQSNTLDSDGDGYSDWVEIHFLGTNPSVADLTAPVSVVAFAASSGTTAPGEWSVVGAGLSNNSIRGGIDYTFTVPAAGFHRLLVTGMPLRNNTADQLWDVLVSFDGISAGRARFDLRVNESGTAEVYTPWLAAGTHTLRVYLDNVSVYRTFLLQSFELQTIGGADANNNGVADWMENRLTALNHLSRPLTGSATSPVCLEGVAEDRAALSLTAASQVLPVSEGVGAGWYAEVPLDAVSNTPIAISYAGGAHTESLQVEWIETNLLTTPPSPRVIRRGDSLLLNAHPEAAVGGSAQILITHGSDQPVALTVDPATPVAHPFASAGTYELTATYQIEGEPPVTVTSTIQVQEAAFAEPAPDAHVGYERNWKNPLLPLQAVLEFDSRLDLSEETPPTTGGRSFRLRAAESGSLRILARLDDCSEAGPILAATTVYAYRINSASETGTYLLEEYPDGSRLVEMPIVVDHVPADFILKLKIFLAGVTFDDGSIVKILTAADFDANGVAKMRFIQAPGVKSSVCHDLRAYQGTEQLSYRRN